MKKLMVVTVSCLFALHAVADTLTDQLHQEIRLQTHHTINISKDTHPILYQLVVDLVREAQVKMPRYIAIFSAKKNIITNDGVMHTLMQDINPSVGIFGDLYLCYEVLLDLSYEDIKSVVALAVSEKANNTCLKPIMLAGLGVLSSIPIYNNVIHDEISLIVPLFVSVPFIIMYQVLANYTQRLIDKNATFLISTAAILRVLERMDAVQEKYTQEGFFRRMASKLGIESIWNILTFPFCSSTFKERIAYLQHESLKELCA
jgi:hypothetical protein